MTIPLDVDDLYRLLTDLDIQIDRRQAAALGAGLGEIIARAAAGRHRAETLCCVCGCPLSDLHCGHSCCCMVAAPIRHTLPVPRETTRENEP